MKDQRRTCILIPKEATVGIGFLIEGKDHKLTEEAKTWAFVIRGTLNPATTKEIESDFSAVKQRPWGKTIAASTFKSFTKLELTKEAMDKLFQEKVDQCWNQLKQEFGAAFDKYPMSVQYALLDMIFNLGRGTEHKNKEGKIVRTGIHNYQQMRKSLDRQHWKEAGDRSRREGPSEKRNETIKQWFYSAEQPALGGWNLSPTFYC